MFNLNHVKRTHLRSEATSCKGFDIDTFPYVFQFTFIDGEKTSFIFENEEVLNDFNRMFENAMEGGIKYATIYLTKDAGGIVKSVLPHLG